MLPLDFAAVLEHIVRTALRSTGRSQLMILSDRGIDLIALFEGFSPVLYNDPAGNATIGFGFLVHLGAYHPSRGVCAACDSYRAGLTEDQGKTLLREKAQTYADCMERSTAIRLNANEHAALTSFAYNLGCAGYVNSSVRPAVNARGDVCSALKQYIYGTDRIAYAGLLRRRVAECELFNTPVATEEDDMKPFLCWNIDRKAVFFVGPFGAAWITDAEDVRTLEGQYGKMTVPLHDSTIRSIAAAAA